MPQIIAANTLAAATLNNSAAFPVAFSYNFFNILDIAILFDLQTPAAVHRVVPLGG